MEKIKIKNLCFSYPGKEPILKNVSFELEEGEFAVLCGKSGSGKSTLLRLLKPSLEPNGTKSGEIIFFSKELSKLSEREAASEIGFILQDTQYQAVTGTVASELAFGLENLGLGREQIRLAVSETASYFSLSQIMNKKISELSGGQRQKVCLASVVAMRPKLLILDEPLSQLDAMAAESLLGTLLKLCRENSMTVLMCEHRLESVVPYADKLIYLNNSQLEFFGAPSQIKRETVKESEFLSACLPTPMKLFCALEEKGSLPLTTVEAKKRLSGLFENKPVKAFDADEKKKKQKNDYAICAKDVWFAYPEGDYVLKGFDLKVQKGTFFALMGENAGGKTTALKLLSGILECKRGSIKLLGKKLKKKNADEFFGKTVAMLPQDPQLLFAGPTIEEDLLYAADAWGTKDEEKRKELFELCRLCEIENLLKSHPYDVSGGEIQRAALAMLLLKKPQILLLDEPTKGMDNLFKRRFAKIIESLCSRGVTVVMVSHDTEFCAEFCDECALLFCGSTALQSDSNRFFSGNYFYTTAANKIARHLFKNAVTVGQVIELCKKNPES